MADRRSARSKGQKQDSVQSDTTASKASPSRKPIHARLFPKHNSAYPIKLETVDQESAGRLIEEGLPKRTLAERLKLSLRGGGPTGPLEHNTSSPGGSVKSGDQGKKSTAGHLPHPDFRKWTGPVASHVVSMLGSAAGGVLERGQKKLTKEYDKKELQFVGKEIGGFSHEVAEAIYHELDVNGHGHLSREQFAAIVVDHLFGGSEKVSRTV